MSERDEPAGRPAGPRHAAPRVSVAGRLRGRALALAAVPTALLVGAAYTPTLAAAETPAGTSCASAPDAVVGETPVPKSEIAVDPATVPAQPKSGQKAGTGSTVPAQKSAAQPGTAAAVPAVFTQPVAAQPTAAAPAVFTEPVGGTGGTGGVQQAGLIDDLLNGIFHPGATTATPSPTPSTATKALPSASASPSAPTKPAPSAPASPGASPSGQATAQPSGGATGSPSAGSSTAAGKAATAPSASASAGPNCLVDARGLAAKAAPNGHVVPEQNWVLHSSKLALHGSVFNGVYDVQMASGATKRVLKFTTASVDIGDLDMSTIEVEGHTFHVKAAPNTTSTMRNGPITMYVESLSGHLSAIYGLPIPIDLGEITLTPDTLPKWLWDLIGAVPIPLDITLDKAKAVQSGQFGGTLHIPGMHLYQDETPYDG